MIARETRSTKRLLLGIFTVVLGAISLIGFPSNTNIAGFGILGGFYGLILIAIGFGLILQKKENGSEGGSHK